jgi:xylan 1,4-beta-xylosidase
MTALALPGFHPDPSICRVGDRHYLITSSFEYAPGVPIFESDDLRSWTQVGNVLARPSQLPVRAGIAGANGGIYAPTLRHHDGRFWMITTNIHDIQRGHLIVHADDARGPWSEPVYTTGVMGIDPDIAWDDEGRCLLTWSDVMRGGISQVEIDPASGALLSEPVEIWRGTGGAHAEGPHLYRRGDWWYLLVAEGGTHTGHMVTVARSHTASGPFEANPANPILSHRSTTDPVQATGHADLVELADGSWAMVHLGIRQRGSFPRWHTNGRESFIVGIDWDGDWPVVDESRFADATDDTAFDDDFTARQLHPRWVAPGAHPGGFAVPGPDGLQLAAGRSADERDARALLSARATDAAWTAQVWADGDVALVLRIDDEHQAMVERAGERVRARIVIGPLDQVVATADAASGEAPLVIRAEPFGGQPGQRQGPDRIILAVGETVLTQFDGRYLSTEVAGGFTGRMVGVEALGAPASVRRFRCTPAR